MATTILPDELWKRLEPLLPKPKENRHVQFAGRKPTDLRKIVTGILFVLRTGIPWPSPRPLTVLTRSSSCSPLAESLCSSPTTRSPKLSALSPDGTQIYYSRVFPQESIETITL